MLLKDAVNEYLLDCRIRKMSERTIRNYRTLLSFLVRHETGTEGVTMLEDVRAVHIKHYLLGMEENGRKPQYINDVLKVFKVFFKYCVQEGYLAASPAARLHNVKQPKVLIRTFSEAEIRRLLGYFSHSKFLDIRNRTILALFFETGIRFNEMATMKLEQVFDDRILIHGKGSKERMVPVSPYLAKMLLRYKTVRQQYFYARLPPEPYVFVSKNGHKLTEEAVTKFMREAACHVDVRQDIRASPPVTKFMREAACHVDVRQDIRVSPHTCRHTFAHLQLKNGLDLYSLSRLLGHENIAITQRYLDGIRTDEVLERAKASSVLEHL